MLMRIMKGKLLAGHVLFLLREKEQAEVGQWPYLLAVCVANGISRTLQGFFGLLKAH